MWCVDYIYIYALSHSTEALRQKLFVERRKMWGGGIKEEKGREIKGIKRGREEMEEEREREEGKRIIGEGSNLRTVNLH